MQKNSYRDTQSRLHISNDVLVSIAACTASEIEGIDSLAADLNWKQLLLHGRTPKAIVADVIDGSAYITISIIVKYGYKITAVASKLQAAVKAAVTNMTGVYVERVNVHIADIAYGEDEK